MNKDRIKALEREVELLKQIIELTKLLEELKAKQPVYVPYVPYVPYTPYPTQPWDPWRITYEPYYPSVTTGSASMSSMLKTEIESTVERVIRRHN